MKNTITLLAIFSVLVSCGATGGNNSANSGQGKRIDQVDALTVDGPLMQNVDAVSDDISKTDLPVLRALNVGNPKYAIMADGSYIATYRYGKDRYFKIIGTRRIIPAKGYAPHSTMKIFDYEIPSYATGNEDPEYTSQDKSLLSSDRNMGTFVFIHGGNRDFNTGKQIENEVPKVSF